jgi:hypothetical protein
MEVDDIPAEQQPQRYYLIHQAGKVASQTLEAALRNSVPPHTRIERHHYLSEAGLNRLEAMSRLEGIEADGAAGVMHQLTLARAVRAEVDASEAGSVCVLSGIRDPLEQSISAFFQNLPIYCPWLDYSVEQTEITAQKLIEFFARQSDSMLGGKPPGSFPEALVRLKLRGIETWFDEEFQGFYGIDAYENHLGINTPFIVLRSSRFKVILYRTELLSRAMIDLLRQMGAPRIQIANSRNVGREKDYAHIYQAFRRKFRPSSAVMDYYCGGRFYRHFYGQHKITNSD